MDLLIKNDVADLETEVLQSCLRTLDEILNEKQHRFVAFVRFIHLAPPLNYCISVAYLQRKMILVELEERRRVEAELTELLPEPIPLHLQISAAPVSAPLIGLIQTPSAASHFVSFAPVPAAPWPPSAPAAMIAAPRFGAAKPQHTATPTAAGTAPTAPGVVTGATAAAAPRGAPFVRVPSGHTIAFSMPAPGRASRAAAAAPATRKPATADMPTHRHTSARPPRPHSSQAGEAKQPVRRM